jgi:hypothetical protein
MVGLWIPTFPHDDTSFARNDTSFARSGCGHSG